MNILRSLTVDKNLLEAMNGLLVSGSNLLVLLRALLQLGNQLLGALGGLRSFNLLSLLRVLLSNLQMLLGQSLMELNMSLDALLCWFGIRGPDLLALGNVLVTSLE